MTEHEKLVRRVANLEVAVSAIIAVAQDQVTPAFQEALERVAEDLYEANRSLGGYQQTTIQAAPGSIFVRLPVG